MRLVHSSDWHLGQTLRDQSRDQEHGLFLDFLHNFIEENKVDVLLVSGDIFDLANPSQEARTLYHRFLAGLSRLAKAPTVVIIAGNHDSPSQLEITREVLEVLNVHVIGRMPENAADALILIRDSSGLAQIIIAAVPFLRGRDLEGLAAADDATSLEESIRTSIKNVYTSVASEAALLRESLARPDLPLVAMGHLWADGSLKVAESVRDIQRGKLGSVPVETLPEVFDYVALGHIHQASCVFKQEHIRYSGAPISLSFSERDTKKELVLVDLPERNITSFEIPVFRRLIQIKGSEAEIQDSIKKETHLQKNTELEPWLEALVPDEAWTPGLADRLKAYARENNVLLLSVRTEGRRDLTRSTKNLGPSLEDLRISEVFDLLFEAKHLSQDIRTELSAFLPKILEEFEAQDEKI